MTDKIDIPADSDGKDDFTEGVNYENADDIKKQESDLEMPRHPKAPKKKFWNTWLGNTIRLKNKTGKAIAAGAAGLSTSFLPEPIGGWMQYVINALILTQTGVGMELLTDLNLIQLIVLAVVAIILWGLPSLFPSVTERKVWKTIEGRLDDVADEVVQAVDKDSEGGKTITRNEWKSIIGGALKKDKEPE